jgi:four helix bundle protein
MPQGFRELIVWQKTMQLTTAVYRLTQQFPREEQYGLTSQIRRAAVSIPSNIAEGQGRLNPAEFRQFLGVARGSNFEVQTQLEIAHTLTFGDPKQIADALDISQEVGRMLHGLVESL